MARKLKKRLSEIENEIEEVKSEFKDLEEKPATEEGEIEPELKDEEPEDIEF